MKRVTIIGKRPATATRESGLKLRQDGYTYQQIADMWHITRARAHQVINPKNCQSKAPATIPIPVTILPPRKRPDLIITEATLD